jgi:nuclease S1
MGLCSREETQMRTPIRRIRVAGLFVTLLLLCMSRAEVQAWGATGCRIAGHIAHDLLTPETRAAIQQLMGSDDLATFALYLDQRKQQLEQQIPGSRAWHDDDVPMCATIPYAQYCANGTCASTQIVRHYRLLSDVHEPKSRQQFAVFVLTHLAGDIHPPLHGADNEAQGGQSDQGPSPQ